MRLIDADALKEQVLLTMKVYKTNGQFDEPLARFCKLLKEEIKAIDHAPTIEAEPVVRCKDCWKLNRLKKYTGFGEVLFVCENTKMTVYETDFCSYGERREP